jgi:hypothetical protein
LIPEERFKVKAQGQRPKDIKLNICELSQMAVAQLEIKICFTQLLKLFSK